jgi:glycosyltransferase involved in cell wall biosynthesis
MERCLTKQIEKLAHDHGCETIFAGSGPSCGGAQGFRMQGPNGLEKAKGMRNPPYRLLLVCTHPVQYAAPIFRRMALDSRLTIVVAYCSLQGAEPSIDADFGVPVAWDVPLLEDYAWRHVQNRSWQPRLGHFWGLFNPGLWNLVRPDEVDAVILLTGYRYASFWISLVAAKLYGKAVLFGTDASELNARDGSGWKSALKRWFWPPLFGLADVVIVPSSCGVALMRSLGIPSNRVMLTPYVVDNDWWSERSVNVERAAVRRKWGVPEQAPVVLFCAKLQPWKRPQDLLRAFAAARIPGAYLVFAGEGPLRPHLEEETRSLGLNGNVQFLGFANQTQLPEVYVASDIMVLPSDYEPFGVVVNEAMLCGCPVVVSDRVGAGYDLINQRENGFVFPFGDIASLAAILKDALKDPGQLRTLGDAARRRMRSWSPSENINALVQAVQCAVERRMPVRE